MKLFYSPGACSLGVQIVLRELGLKFDLVKVDLKSKKYEGGDFKSVNPKGYVPALLLGNGQLLTEGAIILQYLADHHPEKKLFPKYGEAGRYEALEILNFVATELHKGIGSLFAPFLDDKARDGIKQKLTSRLEFLNQSLDGKDFILGQGFSVIDAYLFNVLRWAKPMGVDLSTYANIESFQSRMLGRDSVKAAMAAEGLKS